MSDYIEALEQQIAQIRWWSSEDGRMAARMMWAQGLGTRAPERTVQDVWYECLHGLETSQTFYVSSAIAQAIFSSAETLPEGLKPASELLPVPCAWVYMAHPVAIPTASAVVEDLYDEPGTHMQLQALTWQPNADGFTATFYFRHPRTGNLLPASTVDWGFSDAWDDWHVKDPDTARVRSELAADSLSLLRRVILSLWLFIEQKILVTSEHRPDRSSRRRLEREGYMHEPLVRVVELRRKEVRDRDGEAHADVDWSCRWLVRGHWHKYHTKEGVKAKWLTPYIKGPDDKPLKPPRATVFAVVR